MAGKSTKEKKGNAAQQFNYIQKLKKKKEEKQLNELDKQTLLESQYITKHLHTESELKAFDKRRKRKRIAAYMIVIFAIIGILLSAGLIFAVPIAYNYVKKKIESLNTEIAVRDEMLESKERALRSLNSSIVKYNQIIKDEKEKRRLQKNILNDLKYQIAVNSIYINKKNIKFMPDIDLSPEIKENRLDYETKVHSKGVNIVRGNREFKEIALSFDLGTGADIAYLYALVKKFGIGATVFLSNEVPRYEFGSLFSKRNRKYIKLLAKLGVQFGNHTWCHYNLKEAFEEKSFKRRYLSANLPTNPIGYKQLHSQFDLVEEEYRKITGKPLTKIWRAPYGSINEEILNAAADNSYKYHIHWTIDLLDHISSRRSKLYYSSSEMFERVKYYGKADKDGLNGAIILCHLGSPRKKDKMIKMLPKLISHFQKKGYSFVTVTQALNDKQD